MRKYEEILRDMPVSVICGKYEVLENKVIEIQIEFANKKALSFLKLNIEDIINKDFLNIFPEFKKDKIFNKSLLNSEENSKSYTRYVQKLMSFIKVDIQKVNDKRCLIYLNSITGKDFSENLKENNKIFFVKNREGKYVYWSDEFQVVLGDDNKIIYGFNEIELWGEEIGSIYDISYKKFLDKKNFYSRKICKIHNEIYLIHRYAVYNDDEIVGMIGVLEKIIGQMGKIDYEKLFRDTINENVTDHIVYKDINGVYLDCNESFLKDFNIKREEVIGKRNSEISTLAYLHEVVIKSDKEVINKRKRKVFFKEVIIDGEEKQFEITKEPFFDSYGKLIGIIAIARDVSYRLEMEKLRGEFFANLSHELRTPLNLIFSALQTIEVIESESIRKNTRLNSYINIISQNSKRLLKLVNNLIDSTKIDCGYYDYIPNNEDIVRFVENIAMSVAEFAKKNNITLIFDTNVEEKVMAFDLEMLERIILNLLSNSIKYNNNPGKIEVLLNDCGETFDIIVKDTGIGIPSDKLEVVFERFKQVEDRFIKRSEGSGIGLYIVKSLIEIQGGTIDVKSEIGIGSEFTIKLPVKNVKEVINDLCYGEISDGLVTRMNVEFSDIYM